jgi:NADPH:quinone reductase-like Zn-dependent oxidoreductase
MKAIRVHKSGGIDALRLDETPCPVPGAGEVLVAVKAAGVGPWDRLAREGQEGLGQALPLTVGSDISGTVAALGADVDVFALGEAVYGATNDRFVGGYAEYALAEAGRVARKPAALDYVTAAGLPVVAVTAWQMLFEYARIEPGQAILVRGAAGSVGACATQMAKEAGASVYRSARTRDIERVRALGAEPVVEGDGVQLASCPSMRLSTPSAATHSRAPPRLCAPTELSSPSCAPRTRPMPGREACARLISSSTSRATDSTGYRRWF